MAHSNKFEKKPYCKVCHDAGKPEREYTSHWVKDRDGKTLCPTLLNTECRYCFKLGHTAKFCQALAKNNKKRDSTPKCTVLPQDHRKNTSFKAPANSFAALECDSDLEEEITPIGNLVEDFPTLKGDRSGNKKDDILRPVVQSGVKTGWAEIAAKPAEVKQVVPQLVSLQSNCVSTDFNKISPPAFNREWLTKSWADWSESDSEEEDLQVKPWTTVCATQTITPGWSTAVVDDDDW